MDDPPGPATKLRYGADYREKVELEDGSEVWLRPIRPDDKQRLLEAFSRLSETSRYQRFLSDRVTLDEKTLRFLTEVDGWDHVCLVALDGPDDATAHGLASARFVRDADDPQVAEPAVTVIDEWQGRGLGRALLVRLMEAARERGVTVFRSTILASNEAIRRLVEQVGGKARVQRKGELLMIEFDLPEATELVAARSPEDQSRWDAIRRFFRLAASRILSERAD
ncbi:MAG: GNAT family N-acetyltransferase [Acidobacteria bacterium]|nr:MAG: GNAT family N-acetyltransferase [Acidobacteriota bacterium]